MNGLILLHLIFNFGLINGCEEYFLPNTTAIKLCCPDTCEEEKNKFGNENNKKAIEAYENCCQCHGSPEFKFFNWPVLHIHVEYLNVRGKNLLVHSNNNKNTNSINITPEVTHTFGMMSSLPGNLCNFPNLKRVNLSHNKITSLENISCLSSLDSLILNYNNIKKLKESTFLGMVSLRVLELDNNKIISIEPYSVGSLQLNILKISMQNNPMESIDITNLLLQRPFCKVDYSHSCIEEITNEENWSLPVGQTLPYGGFMVLQGVALTSFPDLETLGIPPYILAQVASFGFDLENVKLECDCHLVPFLKRAKDFLEKIWRNYYNITCHGPPHLKNISIPQLIMDDRLGDFICNISALESCPIKCYCFNQPSQDKIVVNCTNKGLTEMPKYMPQGAPLEIHLQGNFITQLEVQNYLNNTNYLNLANNSFTSINDDFVLQIHGIDIDLSGNPNLKDISKEIQNLNPCNVHLDSKMELECTCDNRWVSTWSKYKQICPNKNHKVVILCVNLDGSPNADDITSVDIGCEDNFLKDVFIALIVLLSVIIVSLLVMYYYRYEMYLILKKKASDDNINYAMAKYDAIVSYDFGNQKIREWIRGIFVPKLETDGYKIYLHDRDAMIGGVRKEEFSCVLSETCNAIVIMSENYFAEDREQWGFLEWRLIWESFKQNLIRHIIIINFDLMRKVEIKNPAVRAFFRLRRVHDFSNRNKKLLQEVEEKLWPPIKKQVHDKVKRKTFNNGMLYATVHGTNYGPMAIFHQRQTKETFEDDQIVFTLPFKDTSADKVMRSKFSSKVMPK